MRHLRLTVVEALTVTAIVVGVNGGLALAFWFAWQLGLWAFVPGLAVPSLVVLCAAWRYRERRDDAALSQDSHQRCKGAPSGSGTDSSTEGARPYGADRRLA